MGAKAQTTGSKRCLLFIRTVLFDDLKASYEKKGYVFPEKQEFALKNVPFKIKKKGTNRGINIYHQEATINIELLDDSSDSYTIFKAAILKLCEINQKKFVVDNDPKYSYTLTFTLYVQDEAQLWKTLNNLKDIHINIEHFYNFEKKPFDPKLIDRIKTSIKEKESQPSTAPTV